MYTRNSRMSKSGSKSSCCKIWIRDAETCSPLPIAEASDRLYKEETQIHTWEGADGWVAGTAGQCGSMELRWAAPNCRRCAAHPNSWMQQRHSHHFPWKPCNPSNANFEESPESKRLCSLGIQNIQRRTGLGSWGKRKKKQKKAYAKEAVGQAWKKKLFLCVSVSWRKQSPTFSFEFVPIPRP